VYIDLVGDEIAIAMRVGHLEHICMAYRMWADDVSDPKERKKWIAIAECIEDQITKANYKASQANE